MKTRVEISPQVANFIRRLAPQPRKALRTALRQLAGGRGDIKPLEAELQGFFRLRVGRYRVIYHYALTETERLVRCDYAERRSLIYDMFADSLVETLRRRQ